MIVTTRHSSSKLYSTFDAPIIPATEPESPPYYPQQIADQVRDEGLSPSLLGRDGVGLFSRGLTPPPMLYRP